MSTPNLQQDGPDGRFRLSGALTFDTVPELLARSRKLLPFDRALEIDLAGVDRIDSAGLALLIEWMRLAAARGQVVVFQQAPAQMRDLARVSGLDGVLLSGPDFVQQKEGASP